MIFEREQSEEMGFVEINSLSDVVALLTKEKPGIVLFDLDNTLKYLNFKNTLKLKLGHIEANSMRVLETLKQSGWITGIVTNQPRRGHQLARFLGKRNHYPYFPDSAEELLGENAIFGGGKLFFLPGRHYKSTSKSLEDVRWFAVARMREASNGIYVVGDRIEDKKFAEKLDNDLSTYGLSVREFIKLPDPPYPSFAPQILKKFIP